eukprot:TRINITY_DN905_c2_g1_i2.p1 TRINITY_DN905_c2_g1~~TRINITY_DN905_c2_g1_i2.p1  ORF type:complete len:171 (+),score=18.51 TRINITY_DN905_c2_g1_i2:43-555(+)
MLSRSLIKKGGLFRASPRLLGGTALSERDEAALAYCRDLVEKHERLHRLASHLISDPRVRDAVLVSRALNIEAALVQDKVRDSAFGDVRIAFWRDGVRDALEGTPPAHPLLRAVAVMAPELRPQRAQLARLVSARARHLREGDACALARVEARAEETQGGVLHAGLAIVS